MTSLGNTHQHEEERGSAAWDAARTVRHGIDELRQAYAVLMLNLNRAKAVTAGSRHVLPARALRHWTAALGLAERTERCLIDGIAELHRVPTGTSLFSAGDVIAALQRTVDEVRASTASLNELRHRLDDVAAEAVRNAPGEAPPPAERSSWRESIGALDELTARMQQGSAALATYANGIFGVDPLPGRTARALALAQAAWHPPDSVALGAELAGKLVDRAGYRPQDPPVPAHLRVPFRRRAAWHSGRGFWASGGLRLFRPNTDVAFFDDCLRATLLLVRGNTIWYADRLNLFRRAHVLDGYADALAAAVVVAVDRRLVPGRDDATVRRLAKRLHDRYDGGSHDVPTTLAEALVRAALGEAPPPRADTARLILLQTLLLVDLLADERPSRDELASFRAEAVEVASSLGPARLAAAPAGQDQTTRRERTCDG